MPLPPPLLPGAFRTVVPPPILDGHGMGGVPESLAHVGQWALALELGDRAHFCCYD